MTLTPSKDENEIRLGADNIPDPQPRFRLYRGNSGDPLFGFLIGMAVSIGLTPILPSQADLRYTLALGTIAGISVLAWLLGTFDRIEQESVDNLAWGTGFGILFSVPFFLFFSGTLSQVTRLIFPSMTAGELLAYLVFVMPMAETLFFRGLMQRYMEFWFTGLMGGLWSIVLLFPVMWTNITTFPAVAFFLVIALVSLNMLYSYVRERNGLAAAWICQIVAGFILLFIPYL
jgi:membrane protease YdiL (CAAX protease family)